MFKRVCFFLLISELLLGVAHLLWPEYRWGQGRRSYFNFNNSLTFASWLASMQLLMVAVLAAVAFHRDTREARVYRGRWMWWLGALAALGMSLAEMTRFHERLRLFGYPNPDLYEQFVFLSLWLGFLALFGWFLLNKLSTVSSYYRYGVLWLGVWALQLSLQILAQLRFFETWETALSLFRGWAYLFGCTFLALSVGGLALRSGEADTPEIGKESLARFPQGTGRVWTMSAVGGMTFTIIFLQIILFQMLTIFGDYLTAHSIISIALLGISGGGLIGYFTAASAPLGTLLAASLLLPVSILAAFGATVSLIELPLFASIVLALPFVAASTVITIVLVRNKTHVVYFIDLIGAALGALLVSSALTLLREESSLLFLGAFTFVLAGIFVALHPDERVRRLLFMFVVVGAMSLVAVGSLNLQEDWMNVVEKKIQKRYPNAKVLFSRSSLVGRYDVIRRRPTHRSLSAYDNGRIIDTIRRNPTDAYQIDPRVPHTLMEDPLILILGLSGDGIAKTAKFLGREVYGVEINPAIVKLQQKELLPLNGDSYKDIEVAVMDGRSYIEQSDRSYDMITLMNAHSARGRTEGRSPSPEYLHTREAAKAYLQHLTERGVLIVEEPVSRPRREPPVWKFLVTLREALVEEGAGQPEKHFFIFQWRTRTNNYIQILMKKNPFGSEEIVKLRQWLRDVDNRKGIEARAGRRMGPITCKTTILHSPDQVFSTNYSRIVRGEVDRGMVEARNLWPTTDNRPFHFDVDPARPQLKQAYWRTFSLVLLLSPFFLSFVVKFRRGLSSTLPYISVVTLTGLAYFLIEVVLIQRCQFFLGTPIVTFSTVIGTLLLFSGLGSLWSGRVGPMGLHGALGGILLFLMLHQWGLPTLFSAGAMLPVSIKVMVVVISLAPLAFFMGVPFPFVLRIGKSRFTEAAPAMLFAINAAASALAVPLAHNLSMSAGFKATFQVGMVLYALVAFAMVALHRPRVQKWATGLALAAVALLLICPWLLSRAVSNPTEEKLRYRVYGIHYGRSAYREARVIRGGSRSQTVPFAWLYWLIEGHERTVLVDTGFDNPSTARRRGVSRYVRPVDRLGHWGIHPSEISDIVLTHGHWDHIGSIGRFPDARIWLQEQEFAHVSRSTRNGGQGWDNLQALLRAQAEGRLRLVSGRGEIAPGITLQLGGAHTPGSQYVTVETLDGLVVIAGDATYLYENNRWHKPIGSATDYQANLAAIKDMHRTAASPFFILPGHDPLVMRWFPQVAEGFVQIATIPE